MGDRAKDTAWEKIFDYHKIDSHNFSESPFPISADMIKKACQNFTQTGQKEPRILCKQDTREDRPQVFQDRGIFILPVKNGHYVLVRGEGYVDIPEIKASVINYTSALYFTPKSSFVGDSEMQHLDYAHAVSMVRTFVEDDSLVLTIRGRKYTPHFSFRVGEAQIDTQGVQTEVDSGYEGRDKVVLIEAKNSKAPNTIIRQLYYPYRQWGHHVPDKEVQVVFFMHADGEYHFWQFGFTDMLDYNSINLIRSVRYCLD